MHKDLIGSIVLLGIAAFYYWASTGIPSSSLEDAIGPRGLPTVLAVMLAFIALAIGARALVSAPAAAPAASSGKESEAPWPRALGLLAIGALYIPVVEILGYLLTLFVLLVGVALYEGLRPSWRLFAIAGAGAGFFWWLFAVVLGIRQPAGLFF